MPITRSGQIRGQRLGVGAIAQNSLTATKRVTALLSGTTTRAPASLVFTQGQTVMATIDTVQINLASLPGTVGGIGASLSFRVATLDEGGTITIQETTGTLNQDLRLFVTITGRPDPNRIG